MYYEVYNYHCSYTVPVQDKTARMYGVELETDDFDCGSILDMMIEDNYLTAPTNEDETQGLKQIEEDGSVFREIILRADYIENLKRCFYNLDSYLYGNVCNGRGTSCHIHINRAFLNENGVTATNICKLIEFYAPILYAVSDRDEYYWDRWSQEQFYFRKGSKAINWEVRIKDISRNFDFTANRYTLVNTSNNNTIELRGLSNYRGFHYGTLCMFIDLVDFIVEQSISMVGKYYNDEWERLLKELEDFFKSEYPSVYQSKDLKQLFHFNRYQYEYEKIYKKFRRNPIHTMRTGMSFYGNMQALVDGICSADLNNIADDLSLKLSIESKTEMQYLMAYIQAGYLREFYNSIKEDDL